MNLPSGVNLPRVSRAKSQTLIACLSVWLFVPFIFLFSSAESKEEEPTVEIKVAVIFEPASRTHPSVVVEVDGVLTRAEEGRPARLLVSQGEHRIDLSVRPSHESHGDIRELYRFSGWLDGVSADSREIDVQAEATFTAVFRPEYRFSISRREVPLGTNIQLEVYSDSPDQQVEIYRAAADGCYLDDIHLFKKFAGGSTVDGRFTANWKPTQTGEFAFSLSNNVRYADKTCLTGHVGKRPDVYISIEPKVPRVGQAVEIRTETSVQGCITLTVGGETNTSGSCADTVLPVLWTPQSKGPHDVKISVKPSSSHHVDVETTYLVTVAE